MSTEKSQTLIRFREHLGGFFHDFLRASGITMMPGNAHERIRSIGERMARTIESAAEVKAIEVIRRLQKVVSESFTKVEDELNKITARLNKHSEVLTKLIKQHKSLIDEVEAIRKRLDSSK